MSSKTRGSSTLIINLDDLKPGDHISFFREIGYYHHAIVFEVTNDELVIIHFNNPEQPLMGIVVSFSMQNPSGKGGGSIVKDPYSKESLKKRKQKIYLYEYDEKDCSSRGEVIERAEQAMSGEIPWEPYNLLDNNCEHFATWCKTGKKRSKQVEVAVPASSFAGLASVAVVGSSVGMLRK